MKYYDNDHHTPVWKYFLRSILGIFLALGFFSFWYGIKNADTLSVIFGILSLILGIAHIVVVFKKSRRR